MNPASNERGLNLPAPVNETAYLPLNAEAPETSEASGVEVPASGAEASAAAQVPSFAMPLPTADPPATAAASPTPATDLSLPSLADDGDLIEKEWVNKAKLIVEQTQNDPYKQSQELTIFKADYLQKRYGKTIKLSE